MNLKLKKINNLYMCGVGYMSYTEIEELIYKICEDNNIDKSNFFVASVGYGKNLIYDFINKKDKIEEKYIIRYFDLYKVFVIWNRAEHKKETKKLTITKNDFNKIINSSTDRFNKGIEYRCWKSSKAYVFEFTDLEKVLIKYFK